VLHEALHLQIAHQQAGAELEEPEQQASRDYSNKEAEREHHAANELQAKGSSSRCTLRCDTMSWWAASKRELQQVRTKVWHDELHKHKQGAAQMYPWAAYLPMTLGPTNEQHKGAARANQGIPFVCTWTCGLLTSHKKDRSCLGECNKREGWKESVRCSRRKGCDRQEPGHNLCCIA